jgi:hypothetical protein
MALNGWSKKCPITITNSLVTGDIAAAQVLLNASNVPAELLADVGGCNLDGSDIRFATDVNGNNLLDFDIQMIDKSADEIVVHVKTALSGSVDTIVYLFWGNPSAQLPLSTVWSEYYAAIHFQEATVGDGFKTAKDSAGTYNALSEKGTPVHVNGKVAGQKAWNILQDNYAILEEEMNISGDFYFEFLVNFNGTAPTAGTQNVFSPVDYFSGVGSVGIGINYGALVLRDTSIGGAQWLDWSIWHHVAFYRESGTVYYYLDGVLHSSGAFSSDIERLKWLSGADTPAKPVQYPNTNCSISSLRFTRNTPVLTPVDVIQTRWNNYNSTSSFASAGTVETVTQQSTLTIVNVPIGAELRLYVTDPDPLASRVELTGIEDAVSDTYIYSYEYVTDTNTTLQIMHPTYVELAQPIILGSENQTVIPNLQVDNND